MLDFIRRSLRLKVVALVVGITFATLLLTSALLIVYDLRTAPWPVYAWWRRLWTFAYTAFLIHLGFGHAFFEWDYFELAHVAS